MTSRINFTTELVSHSIHIHTIDINFKSNFTI